MEKVVKRGGDIAPRHRASGRVDIGKIERCGSPLELPRLARRHEAFDETQRRVEIERSARAPAPAILQPLDLVDKGRGILRDIALRLG